jgi:predicted transcriptional regulator
MRVQHYQRIVKALEQLKSANYELIAKTAGFTDRNAASRRLPEMVGLGMIYRTDTKTATSSGRSAYNYSLTTQPEMTPIEIVDNIIENAHKPNYIQPDLF